MSNYRVVCITRPDFSSTNEHITEIGYYESPFVPCCLIDIDEAIKRIEANSKEFYVNVPQGTAYVSVVRPAGRDPYIKTVPDITGADNLLRLNQCEL